MMRTSKAGLLCSLILALLFGTLPVSAEISYTDARELIKLHNQYRNYRSTGGLRDGAQGYYDARNFQIQNGKYWCWWDGVYGVDCLEQGGCHAFSYSHAVQWLLQQNLGDEVLHALIDACENPSDYGLYHSYPKCKASAYPHKSSSEAYAQLCADKYGLAALAEGAPDRNAEEWLAFFDAGKIAILLVDGHYNVAVDYLGYDGQTYVQILDSAPTPASPAPGARPTWSIKTKRSIRSAPPLSASAPTNTGSRWRIFWQIISRWIGFCRAETGKGTGRDNRAFSFGEGVSPKC